MTTVDYLPSAPEQLLALARELYSQWRLNEADIALRKLLEDPKKYEVAALNLHAEILWSLGDLDEAKAITEKVLTTAPLDHQAARRARWLELPIDPMRCSPEWISNFLSLGEKPAAIYPPLVRLLNEEGYHDSALQVASEGLELLSQVKVDPRVTNKLILETAISKESLGDLPGALAALAEIDPALPVAKSAALSRARIQHEMGFFKEAEKSLSPHYDNVTPAFNVTRYHIYLSTGRIKEAFALYQSRKETEVFRRLISNYHAPLSFLNGVWKNDKILILAEGGPGDELRMSSLYGDSLAHACQVTISCDPRVIGLLARTYPEARFVSSPRFRDELRKSDYSSRNEVRDALGAKLLTNTLLRESENVTHTVSVFDFLFELRPSREAFLSQYRRYLKPDPDLVAEFKEIMPPGIKRIGLAWRSMINNSTRQKHYFFPEDLYPLRDLPDTEFWILQPEYTDSEIAQLSSFLNVRTLDDIDLVDDFESQSALISCLDAVIAPCTTTAELAGALGVKTIILANTHMTAWRQNQDGSDVWHPRSSLILGDTIGDRCSVIKNAADALLSNMHRPNLTLLPVIKEPKAVPKPSKVSKSNSISRRSWKYRIKKLIASIPGARRLKKYVERLNKSPINSKKEPSCNDSLDAGIKQLDRQDNAANVDVAQTVTTELKIDARENYSLETLAKQLIRQKDVKDIHISQAEEAVSADKTGTMLAVQAVLQARAGRLHHALATVAHLPEEPHIHERILPALRIDLADIGRHDLSKEGLRLLLSQNPGDPSQADIRMGNAEFEREAYEFLSDIEQPKNPKGYVIIFGLNNRVTLGLMTPLAWQLAKDGYHVCSSVAASMKPSELPQLDGISGAIRWSGLSLTDEPANRRKLRNEWHIDLEQRSVVCDDINYFTFFAERLGKFSNSYDVDVNNPKVLADFENLLQRSDVALTVCKRILSLADEGKPIRLAAMDTHFAPAGIVRKWCEEFGRQKVIELIAFSISYENYYSNLTSLEAKTISVENLTAHPDVRHPLFGGRERFDRYIAENPKVLTNKDEVLKHILVNRSKTEEADANFRSHVVERSKLCRANGGKVFAALGKVLIDFAAPYDRGYAFNEFSDWIKFLTAEVAHTNNLLIIKQHPHEKPSELAAPGVQTLRDLLPKELPDNVIFLDHAAFNSYELADLVDLTFVWNGTAYAEFPVLGKPIVAESIWAEKDYPLNGVALASREAYSQVIRGERAVELSHETVSRAIAFIQFMKSPEVSIPFGYVKRAGTNKSIGSIEFIRTDMDAIGRHPDNKLELISSRFFE